MKTGDTFTVTPRLKAALDAIDKCVEEARIRKESDRMKKEYLLNGGMRVTGGVNPELAKAMQASRELLKGHPMMEVVKGGATPEVVKEGRANVKLKIKEIMETKEASKAIVIEHNTSLHSFIEDHMANNASKMKDAKLEILDAFLELNDIDEEDTVMARKVMYNYKFLLDYIEEAVMKSGQLKKEE